MNQFPLLRVSTFDANSETQQQLGAYEHAYLYLSMHYPCVKSRPHMNMRSDHSQFDSGITLRHGLARVPRLIQAVRSLC